MPYIKLEVYGQTVLLDGGGGGMAGMEGGMAGLAPWIRQCLELQVIRRIYTSFVWSV